MVVMITSVNSSFNHEQFHFSTLAQTYKTSEVIFKSKHVYLNPGTMCLILYQFVCW